METIWRKLEKTRDPESRLAVHANRRAWARAVIGLLFLASWLFQARFTFAQSEDDAEYRLKLAFLYNFAQFVIWPPEAFRGPAAPLTLCVAGQDPFQGEIGQDLRGRTAGGHPIQLKRLRTNEDPRSCQMIFVRAGERKLAAGLVSALKGSNTLTVGEAKGFIALGGIINLTQDENKLRFEINLQAAQQSRLKISSKLLALAKIVEAK